MERDKEQDGLAHRFWKERDKEQDGLGLGIANGQKPTLGDERWFRCARSAKDNAFVIDAFTDHCQSMKRTTTLEQVSAALYGVNPTVSLLSLGLKGRSMWYIRGAKPRKWSRLSDPQGHRSRLRNRALTQLLPFRKLKQAQLKA
jgi:hypothetical protein